MLPTKSFAKSDGYLLVNSTSRSAGMFLYVPVYTSKDYWLRFAPVRDGGTKGSKAAGTADSEETENLNAPASR